MAFSINQIFLLGNATRAAELKYTPKGNAVCTFSMATNRGVKNGDEWEDVPTFHRIVVWGKLAEYASREIGKGTKVCVQGRVENRTYKDKDGVDKNISEVIADTVVAFRSGQTPVKESEPDMPVSDEEKIFMEGGEEVKKTGDKDVEDIPF